MTDVARVNVTQRRWLTPRWRLGLLFVVYVYTRDSSRPVPRAFMLVAAFYIYSCKYKITAVMIKPAALFVELRDFSHSFMVGSFAAFKQSDNVAASDV